MQSNVFTYGSLMFPQVWQQVVAGNYRSVRASAPGHARYAVDGETYPGMVAQSGSVVEGVLYLAVDAAHVEALDRFEGEAYRRVTIDVALADGSSQPAATYLYVAPGLSTSPWEPAAFELQRFMQTYCRDRL
jgi:gamma-glutamylcyclotransferase (GGCT)/AIG2-like uncharacterized protein YtfP